ncbi:hypothetical protein DL96DRAFT_1662 [Flagelloscypha sp. PMI_526]|nr:hypothetical protein DL96DRAFT_1662 [Flagelloscypha sp. PMI_526]
MHRPPGLTARPPCRSAVLSAMFLSQRLPNSNNIHKQKLILFVCDSSHVSRRPASALIPLPDSYEALSFFLSRTHVSPIFFVFPQDAVRIVHRQFNNNSRLAFLPYSSGSSGVILETDQLGKRGRKIITPSGWIDVQRNVARIYVHFLKVSPTASTVSLSRSAKTQEEAVNVFLSVILAVAPAETVSVLVKVDSPVAVLFKHVERKIPLGYTTLGPRLFFIRGARVMPGRTFREMDVAEGDVVECLALIE